MKNKNTFYSFAIILVVILAIYFWYTQQKYKEENRKLIDANKLVNDNYDSLKQNTFQMINSSNESIEIKKGLNALMDNYRDDEDIVKELSGASILIEGQQNSKAIMVLVKIIENLLKKIYQNDESVNNRTHSPRLGDLIQYAKNSDFLEKEDIHYLNGLREMRNQEAHEINLQRSKYKEGGSLLLCINLIYKLGRIICR